MQEGEEVWGFLKKEIGYAFGTWGYVLETLYFEGYFRSSKFVRGEVFSGRLV